MREEIEGIDYGLRWTCHRCHKQCGMQGHREDDPRCVPVATLTPAQNDQARHQARKRFLAYATAPRPLQALLDAALEDLRLAGGDNDDIRLLIQQTERIRNDKTH